MTTAYCDADDLANRLSVEGVMLRVDDVPPDTLGDVILDASTIIDEHLFYKATPANLAANDWVRQRCADIAAFLLCERRDNPPGPGMTRKFQYALERLEKMQAGQVPVPNLAVRKTAVPVVSGPRIRLDPYPRTVIERARSTGTAEGYAQRHDSMEWVGDYVI